MKHNVISLLKSLVNLDISHYANYQTSELCLGIQIKTRLNDLAYISLSDETTILKYLVAE